MGTGRRRAQAVPAAARQARVIEPMGLNTGRAIGLAASCSPCVCAAIVMPSSADHNRQPQSPGDRERSARRGSRAGRMVVLGIPQPGRDRFRYIEKTGAIDSKRFPVCRAPIHRKPELKLAQDYVAPETITGSGCFLARIDVPGESEELSAKDETALGKASGIHRNASLPRQIAARFFQARHISVDSPCLNPHPHRGTVERVCGFLPKWAGATYGSWAAVFNAAKRRKCFRRHGYTVDAEGIFCGALQNLWRHWRARSCGRETPDALLICPRAGAQEVGKVVKWSKSSAEDSLARQSGLLAAISLRVSFSVPDCNQVWPGWLAWHHRGDFTFRERARLAQLSRVRRAMHDARKGVHRLRPSLASDEIAAAAAQEVSGSGTPVFDGQPSTPAVSLSCGTQAAGA